MHLFTLKGKYILSLPINNLANKNPNKRDELLKDLQKWLKDTKAPQPTKITAANKPKQGSLGGEE